MNDLVNVRLSFNPQWLPVIQMALSCAASVAYFWAGDFKRATYWAAAAVITWSVTF